MNLAREVEKPPPAAYLELACCNRRALVEFFESELTLVPVFVPVIRWKFAN